MKRLNSSSKYIIPVLSLLLLFTTLNHLQARSSGTFKEVNSTSEPEYLKRKGGAWAEFSRVIGTVKHPPEEYTLEFEDLTLPEGNRVVYSKTVSGDFHIYETEWILPGEYDIVIIADGYTTKRIESVELKARTDCLIHIEFGTQEYNKTG